MGGGSSNWASPMADLLVYIALASVAAEGIALIILARAFIRHRRQETRAPPSPKPVSAPVQSPEPNAGGNLEDVLLLHRSGLLLKHYTRRLRPNMDSDVLSGMLVAVQEFVKDSFRGEGGVLDEIRFGEMRIKVVEGKWTIIAALVRGEATESHRTQIRAALRDLEEKYEDLLIDWDGTMDHIPEVDRIIQRLVNGGYGPTIAEPASAQP